MANKSLTKSVGNDVELSEDALVERLAPHLKPNSRSEVELIITSTMQKFHSGPLPAPDDLEQYGRIVDRGAERIFEMAERQQAHRHQLEQRMVGGEYRIRLVGQMGAIVTIILLTALTAFCASIGQPIVAGIIVAIGTAAAVFLKYSAQSVDAPNTDQPAKKVSRRKRK